jgi:hypothetical protein
MEHELDDILISVPDSDQIFSAALDNYLPGGTSVLYEDIEYSYGKIFLIRMGFNKKKACTISRTELLQDRQGFIYMRISGKSETCKSKDNCTNCDFKGPKFGSGCVCKDGSINICQSIVTRNRDMILWSREGQ